MERQIAYIGQVPMDTDILNTNLNSYIGLAKLSAAVLGTSTQINAFTCTPTSPASMNVILTPGEIYALEAIDTDAYGSIPANPIQILKQGIMLENSANLPCPAPLTIGFSINYLIQVGFLEEDGGSTVLPYYNSANPSQAFTGPANDGLPNDTIRQDLVDVSVKAGTPAPTGTQTTPSPDSGYVGAYVVTVAYGETTIISGNISLYPGAPFIPATLSTVFLYAVDSSVSANTVTVTFSPAITQYTNGQPLYVKISNTNTGSSTANCNGLGAKTIKTKNGLDLVGGEMVAGGIYLFSYDGTNLELLNPSYEKNIQNNNYTYAADTGAANAYVMTVSPPITAYTTGQTFYMKAANTNSSSSTLNVSALGVKNIKLQDGSNPYAGAILSGGLYEFEYDGTNFQLLNPTPSVAIQNSAYVYAADTGAANAYVISPTPAIISYQNGQSFIVKITNANSGTSGSTINVSGLGTKNIITATSTVLIAGQLTAGMMARIVYNGTSFMLENPAHVPCQRTVYTTGSGTYTVPTGAISLDITVQGGGGGGAAGNTAGGTGGGGGGAGGQVRKLINSSISSSYSYSVGAGGAGGNPANSNGSTGSSTTFSTLTSGGGIGGKIYGQGGVGGAGGSASGGDINLIGVAGNNSGYVNGFYTSGAGGGHGGGIGASTSTNTNGNAGGANTGGGGSGGSGNAIGGDGGSGYIIVDAYF